MFQLTIWVMFEKLHLACLRKSKLTWLIPLTWWKSDPRRFGLTCPIRVCQSQYNSNLIAFSEAVAMLTTKSEDRSRNCITLLVFIASSLFATSAFTDHEIDCLAAPKVSTVMFTNSESKLVSPVSVLSKDIWDVWKRYIFSLSIPLATNLILNLISTPPIWKNTLSLFQLTGEVDKIFTSRSGTYKTLFILIVCKATFLILCEYSFLLPPIRQKFWYIACWWK